MEKRAVLQLVGGRYRWPGWIGRTEAGAMFYFTCRLQSNSNCCVAKGGTRTCKGGWKHLTEYV